jgi:chromosome segregation ATPase
VAELERDIDLVKQQRGDLMREIQRLREVQDMKGRESMDQSDKTRSMEYDLEKTQVRIAETQRIIESRNYDIRDKQGHLDDVQREIARLKDLNAQQNNEIVALRRDVDRVSSDCYDLRKNIECTEARNMDMAGQQRSLELQIKEREEGQYACRRDIENLQYTN